MKLIFTTPLPDELLASYLSRLAKINGYRDQRDIWNALSGRSDCTSFIDAKVSFPIIAEAIGAGAETPEGLVKDCTFLPGQVFFGELSDDELLSIVSAERTPTLSQLTFMGPAALKYCEQCVQEDFATHNVSYWHRVHQVPLVKVCPIHQVLLVCVQFKRANLHIKFPMPNEVSAKLTKHQVGEICVPLLAVADIGDRILAVSKECMKAELREVIWDELGSRRYLGRGGVFHRHRFVADLIALLEKHFFPTPTEVVKLRKIVPRHWAPRSTRMALGSVVLIYFLFGSWAGLLERSRWVSTFGSRYAGLFEKMAVSPREHDPGRAYRNECADFIARHPNGTRLEFTRKHYRAFRWLSRYDLALLDHLLPIPVGRAKQFELFD